MHMPGISEISNIEILRGTAESLTQPNCKISMPTVENPTGTARTVILPNAKTSIDVGILLNGVCDVNGGGKVYKGKCTMP